MVSERSPLLSHPVPATHAVLPRPRSHRSEPQNGWVGRLSVYTQSVEFDTGTILKVEKDGLFTTHGLAVQKPRKFERDVVLLRMAPSASNEPNCFSVNGDSYIRFPTTQHTVEDGVSGTGEVR